MKIFVPFEEAASTGDAAGLFVPYRCGLPFAHAPQPQAGRERARVPEEISDGSRSRRRDARRSRVPGPR